MDDVEQDTRPIKRGPVVVDNESVDLRSEMSNMRTDMKRMFLEISELKKIIFETRETVHAACRAIQAVDNKVEVLKAGIVRNCGSTRYITADMDVRNY